MISKKNLLIFSLFSINAMSSTFESGLDLDFNFKPKENKISHKLVLGDLKYEINKNIKFNAKFITQRDNIYMSDNNNFSFKKNERYNHDIMGKLNLNLKYDISKELKVKGDVTYYLDDFSKEHDKFEYLDGNEKANLGDIILNSSIEGKKEKLEYEVGAEYKSRNLFLFNNKESYFKFDTKVSSKFLENDDLKLESSYSFFVDLDLINRPFDPLNTDFDEFPDYMAGDRVTYLKNDLKLLTDYKENEISLELNHYAFLTQSDLKSKYKTMYNVSDINLKYLREFKFKEDLKLSGYLENKFQIKDAYYIADEGRNNVRELSADYHPKLGLSLNYGKSELSLSYGPSFLIAPDTSTSSMIPHEFELTNKVDYSNEKLKVKNNTKIEYRYRRATEEGYPAKVNNFLDLNYKDKIRDNLSYELGFKNLIDLNTQKKLKFVDKLNIQNKLSFKLKYNILKDLDLTTELTAKNLEDFNYVLRTKNKKLDNSDANESYGTFILTAMENILSLNTDLSYKKELNEKLTLNTGLDFDLSLETLLLRSEKMYSYTSNSENTEEKIEPLLSDDIHKRFNVGGKVESNVKLGIEYKILKGLSFNALGSLGVKLEKKVIDKVVDEYRPDKGQYARIDKDFKYKGTNLGIKLGIKYEW